MTAPSDQAPVTKGSAAHLPRGTAYVVWGAATLCLAVILALAFAAVDTDRRTAEDAFAVKAERSFAAVSDAIGARLDLLHRAGLLVDARGLPTLPGSLRDSFGSLDWAPSNSAATVERLASFRDAIAAAARPGSLGFAAADNGTHLLVALRLPVAERPGAPAGHLLASLPLADVMEHARQVAGIDDGLLAVGYPGSTRAPLPRPDGGLMMTRRLSLHGTDWLASVTSRGPTPVWWRGPMLANVLAAGTAITLAVLMGVGHLARHAREACRARHDETSRLAEVTGTLKRVDADARVAWRMLKDENFIDGYALWDAEDRLVDFSGYLGRYLPDLALWDRPSAQEVVGALVNGGHVVLPDGVEAGEAIARMCMMRREVPGLREVEMIDGQIYLGRTIDLGEGRHACVFTNITELRARERETREAETLFRTTFESVPLMMVLLNHDERPVAVNRAFTAVLGYSFEQIAEVGWHGILDPHDLGGTGAGARSPPWAPMVKRIVAADGSVVRGQVRFTPVRDAHGNREGRLLVTIEDLTSRWEAEERVRYQASLLDQVTNAVLSVDRWGRIVYGNRAAQTLFQWTEQVLHGTPVDRLLGAEVAAVLTEPRAEVEGEGVTWSGGRFPASVTVSRLVDDTGEAVGNVLVVADLTQRRALDLQLMHSARLATLGEMTASIAHEFNQCLHVIRLSSEALRMDLADGGLDLGRVGKRADNILSQVDRLTEMVTQMRSISRRDGSSKRAFPPQTVLDSAVRMVEPLMVADGVHLVRLGGLDNVAVLGHPVRLEQVLLNLLNNARDAIHDRAAAGGTAGGTVTVVCETDAAAGRLAIRISDDGGGVPDEVAATLFEPFITTKDDSRGCGLGLPISRGIVHEMGGSLGFRNLERGAEFSVELPIAPAAPPPADAPDGVADDDAHDDDDEVGDGRRVLLVDDEALSVMMVAEFLERQGYLVDTAYDGLEALAKVEADVYDAVITDIRMPRLDGTELIRRLEHLQPGTPVIVVTGNLNEGRRAELGANVVAVLTKPFQLLDLRQQLTRAEAATGTARHQEGV